MECQNCETVEVIEASELNSNLESNQNKTMIRPTISNQLFQAKFKEITGISLGGEKGMSERTIIDRANFQKIPIRLDYVEFSLPCHTSPLIIGRILRNIFKFPSNQA